MLISLEEAVAQLQRGEVVAVPTETVYGLAADASNEEALREVYARKERPASNPLIVHIASSEQVLDWASEYSDLAKKLALTFWPGPFTLVLPAKEHVSSLLRAGAPTVALRVPSHDMTQQLLQRSGLALAAPSANKYTQLSPTTAAHVSQSLGPDVAVLDGGACQVGIESTIVAVQGEDWRLLRLGMIAEADIAAAAGKPAVVTTEAAPKAPGQHRLHYSPSTPIRLFETKADLIDFAQTQTRCAALFIGEGHIANGHTFNLEDNASRAAEMLYDTLHQMDDLGVDWLLVERPPQAANWLAINDRLSRAAQENH